MTGDNGCGRIAGQEPPAATDRRELFPPIVTIAGPTAVGKSALALELARTIDAEIVSVDSRQVFRYLDIGTAKPTAAEQREVRHHLIDLVDPDQSYSAAEFRADADRALLDIRRRGRVALLVGGTGHYLQSVVERLEFPRVAPQEGFRREMEALARSQGWEALHQRLREVDPGADLVPAQNVRRVIRALEVQMVTGVPFTEIGRKRGEPLPALRLGLTMDREGLYRRIDDRVERQIRDGLFDEARSVLDMGFEPGLPPLAGLVYREAIAVVQDRMTVAEAARRMRETTHAYSRRQYTWFRRDPAIQWFDAGPGLIREITGTVEAYLESQRQAQT